MAAGKYNCVTPALEALVRRSTVYLHCREDFKQEHAEALKAMLRPFRTTGDDVDGVKKWQGQYDKVAFRYYALWLWGASHMAKSRYSKSLYPQAFWHNDVVNWNGYDPSYHTAVFFDDAKEMVKVNKDAKVAFQSSGDADFGASATNCHLVTVDLLAKPIAVMQNYKPYDDSWIDRNFHVVEVVEPMATPDPDEPEAPPPPPPASLYEQPAYRF